LFYIGFQASPGFKKQNHVCQYWRYFITKRIGDNPICYFAGFDNGDDHSHKPDELISARADLGFNKEAVLDPQQ
jgi:hypothetical protein